MKPIETQWYGEGFATPLRSGQGPQVSVGFRSFLETTAEQPSRPRIPLPGPNGRRQKGVDRGEIRQASLHKVRPHKPPTVGEGGGSAELDSSRKEVIGTSRRVRSAPEAC